MILGSTESGKICLVIKFNYLGLKMLLQNQVIIGWVRLGKGEDGGEAGRLEKVVEAHLSWVKEVETMDGSNPTNKSIVWEWVIGTLNEQKIGWLEKMTERLGDLLG